MHGRVRGIALLCVQMMKRHISEGKKLLCNRTELIINFDLA